jgi:hypothetical protein
LVRLIRTASLRATLLAVLAAATLVGCGSGTKPAAACPAGVPKPASARSIHDAPPPVPARGAYLGAFALNGGTFSQSAYIASVNGLQRAICRPLDIVHSFLQWQQPFPTQSAVTASRSGQIVLLSWTGTDLAAMASGSEDAAIRTVAGQIASLHSPVFLELRWEMDRPNLTRVVHSPATFVAAWDHTRQVFAQAGVRNVSWVWCPTAAGFARGAAPAYYPGADQVDWICTDAYPNPRVALDPLQTELTPFLAWAKSQGKPLMIGEFGVPQSYSSDDRRAWVQHAAAFIKATPQIKAVVYFDYNPVGHAATQAFRLQPGSSALAAFRALGADPWFRPRVLDSAPAMR